MSGMTTTGSSMLTDIPALSHSIAMWRQFTAWLGGMGIIVLALAVLPRLRVGGRQLMESEAPGPELEPLATSIRDTARRLWLLYVGLTILMIFVLSMIAWTGLDSRMSFYEAVAHAFSTMPTAGFSTRARSIEEFGAASQWAIAAFMIIAGMNFALLYFALVRGHIRKAVRDEELRLYMALLAVATLVIFIDLTAEGIEAGAAAFRHAAFQTASIMTTTGLASTDFNLWTPLTALVLLLLMFIGGSAGSTAGAIKVVRHPPDRPDHAPRARPDGAPGGRSPDPAQRPGDRRANAARGLGLRAHLPGRVRTRCPDPRHRRRAGAVTSPRRGDFAAATTLGNVGPGFGFLGPMGSFEPFSNFSTAVMTMLMWMGRLELLPIVVLLTRSYWRA